MNPEIQPVRPSPAPQRKSGAASTAQRRGPEDLPPSARGVGVSDTDALSDSAAPANPGKRVGGWAKLLIALGAAAALGFLTFKGPAAEESASANWPHVAQATESGQALAWLGAGGGVTVGGNVLVGDADLDSETTAAIRSALMANDTARADQLFAEAQRLQPVPDHLRLTSPAPQGSAADDKVANDAQVSTDPTIDSDGPTIEPPQATLTEGMRSEILSGDARFYHIHLYDSCWNDGDVVEVLLNGQPTFLAPITNSGCTLSVPVTTGTTVISIRGVYDGGGGITVACRTSQGEGFVRVMAPGEIQPLGIVQ